MTSQPITVTLDRPREVRWTMRAQARMASLARPVTFASVARKKNALYAVLALIWASLVDRDHEFDAPEDLAEFFKTDEQQSNAIKVLLAVAQEAFPEKKSPPNESSSSNGLDQSSKSESASPQSTSGG
jgi:hypothetical protein